MQTVKCEVWILVDEHGNYVAHDDVDSLAERFEDAIGACNEAGGMRRVKVTVEVPLPITLECQATAPQEPETASAVAE